MWFDLELCPERQHRSLALPVSGMMWSSIWFIACRMVFVRGSEHDLDCSARPWPKKAHASIYLPDERLCRDAESHMLQGFGLQAEPTRIWEPVDPNHVSARFTPEAFQFRKSWQDNIQVNWWSRRTPTEARSGFICKRADPNQWYIMGFRPNSTRLTGPWISWKFIRHVKLEMSKLTSHVTENYPGKRSLSLSLGGSYSNSNDDNQAQPEPKSPPKAAIQE